jgi:hypothetical protein
MNRYTAPLRTANPHAATARIARLTGVAGRLYVVGGMQTAVSNDAYLAEVLDVAGGATIPCLGSTDAACGRP